MYVLTVALRHLRARPMTWVASVIIALIVIIYLLVISVLEGFKANFMEKLQSLLAHGSVRIGNDVTGIQRPTAWGRALAEVPGVRGVSPSLEIPVIAQFKRGRTTGVLRGIDLAGELKHGRLKEYLRPGGLKEFRPDPAGPPGCIVGGAWQSIFGESGAWWQVAWAWGEGRSDERAGLHVGDTVTFVFSNVRDEALFEQFKIIGFFEGEGQFLEHAAYVDWKFLAEELGTRSGASYPCKSLAFWVEGDPDRRDLPWIRDAVYQRMQQEIGRDIHPAFRSAYQKSLVVETWREKNEQWYYALTRENLIMRIIMVVFLFLMGVIILLILSRAVAEKVRDIGALRALGATPRGIMLCFLLQGFLIAGAGLAAGLPVAWAMVAWLNEILEAVFVPLGIDLFPEESFLISRVPTNLLAFDVHLIIILTVGFALLGALLPAWRASRLDPVECLRRE